MDDSEIIAAVAAGDPAALAGAYDKYAPGLYGYCCWVLGKAPYAAAALLETFATAAPELAGRKDASETRAWLYALARAECYRHMRTAGPSFDEMAEQARAPTEAAHLTELRELTRAALAELQPQEHEIIELSIRHGLHEAELAAVLGISPYQAHALTSQARDDLAKILDGLLVVSAWRRSCPELGSLLADRDGQLTVQTGKVAAEHIDHCERCTLLRRGPVRPEVLYGLLPLAPIPPELREPILQRAAAATAPASRGGTIWRTGSAALTGFQLLGRLLAWGRIRANPGAATAAAAVGVWVVAAVSATLITVTGLHPARALTIQTHPAAPAPTRPAASNTASPSANLRPRRSPRPTSRPTRVYVAPPEYVAPVTTSPSPTKSAKPAPYRSAKPSASSSASSSASPSPTPADSRTSSATPTPPASPASSAPSPSPSSTSS